MKTTKHQIELSDLYPEDTQQEDTLERECDYQMAIYEVTRQVYIHQGGEPSYIDD